VTAPRFGVWAPVYGNHGARLHPGDAPDASYRRTRDLLQCAERAGFDSTLLAQHVIHPSNTEDDVLETWSTLAALAEATSRIELIGAVKPLLFNPLLFAKIAANIADIADGRLAVNLVTGWFLPELEGLGLDPLDHDDRYAYSREWLEAVTELWTGKQVAIGNRGGQHALVRPIPVEPPALYVGGESEPDRALAAERADVFFINGRPLAETVEVIEDLRARPRDGAPLRFGLSAFVIARESEAEAILMYAMILMNRHRLTHGLDAITDIFRVGYEDDDSLRAAFHRLYVSGDSG
jgi:alkanesulfonate monooxygenase